MSNGHTVTAALSYSVLDVSSTEYDDDHLSILIPLNIKLTISKTSTNLSTQLLTTASQAQTDRRDSRRTMLMGANSLRLSYD